MDVEPFYYLRAGDVVPRDAVWLVIGGSVTVVPPYTFEGYQNLARVEFQEGVEEIGHHAFTDCRNLTHLDGASSLRSIGHGAFAQCERLSEVVLWEGLQQIGAAAFYFCGLERLTVPSSVVEICDDAFVYCKRLSKVILLEGLRQIGERAFHKCDLRRITVPSSVEEIDDGAFADCGRLSEVGLREGLRRIGGSAFEACALRRIIIPSSVVEIGANAFYSCDDLEAVGLAGGMVLVEEEAFEECPRLEQIAIPSMAIVIQVGEGGNARTEAVTGGIEWDARNQFPQQLILTSPQLVSMPPEDLRHLTRAIDQITETPQAVGSLDLSDRDVSARIRDCFIDRMATWYEQYKNEVAATLELGLWKIELGRARGAGQGCPTGGGKRARANVPTRDNSRRTCGADPIIGLGLPALAGPHRRADQAENARPFQP